MANAAPLFIDLLGGRRFPRLIAVGLLAFWITVICQIDRRTVISHTPGLEEIAALGPDAVLRLREAGITDPFLLVERADEIGLSALAEEMGLPETDVDDAISMARLAVHAGMGTENARVLHGRGIRRIEDLPRVGAETIRRWLREDPEPRGLSRPRPAVVRLWVRAAE